MFRARLTLIAASAAAALLLTSCGSGSSGNASGDGSWAPSKPIELVAPAATGGGWDTLARTSGRILEDTGLIDKSIRVVNKPGGGGAIGWAYIANNSGDPHKLFVTSPPILLVPLAGESDHDHTSFTPIARLATEYMAYLVAKDSPFKTFADLVGELKKNPAKVSVAGGSAPGSMDHVALAGAVNAGGAEPGSLNYVPFDGGGEALTALLGGHTDVAVVGASEAAALLASGDLRALAVSAPERISTLPEVPTLVESGIDYTFDIWRGVMGPSGLSAEQVAYYENAFAKLAEREEWKNETSRLGWINSYQGSAEFKQFLDDKKTEFAEILTEVGLRKA
jgi:putative tricarboxylic transport membrane protein